VKPTGIPIKYRPAFRSKTGHFPALIIIPLGQQLWYQMDHAQRGDFDACKEKADYETITTDAAACPKRDQLP
jgi:hypothetical protein